MTDIELLATIVRGDRDITASLSSVDAEVFYRRAAEHGVLRPVAERSAHSEHVPAALRTLLRTTATDALVMDLSRVAELAGVSGLRQSLRPWLSPRVVDDAAAGRSRSLLTFHRAANFREEAPAFAGILADYW
jgi:hypothetical protein